MEVGGLIGLVHCVQYATGIVFGLGFEGGLFACLAVVTPPDFAATEFAITIFHSCYQG